MQAFFSKRFAALVIELFEAIEAIPRVAHDVTGLRHVVQHFRQPKADNNSARTRSTLRRQRSGRTNGQSISRRAKDSAFSRGTGYQEAETGTRKEELSQVVRGTGVVSEV